MRLKSDGGEPLPFVTPAARHAARGAGRRVQPARPAQPPGRHRLSRRSAAPRPHQVLRAGLRHADRRARDAATSTARRTRRSALYGLDQRPDAQRSASSCLAARRLVERGVRFVQIFHGGGGGGAWDAHGDIKTNHTQALGPGRSADRRPAEGPEAARPAGRHARRLGHRVRPLARRRRRRPRSSSAGFCAWLAGGGIKGGVVARRDRRARLPRRRASRTTSPTSTPPCCTSSASTRGGWKSPAASGWRSTTGSRSARSSPKTTVPASVGNGLRAVPAAAKWRCRTRDCRLCLAHLFHLFPVSNRCRRALARSRLGQGNA